MRRARRLRASGFSAQRMNKVGDQLLPWNATGTDIIITGWVSDATEIATIVGDKLVITEGLAIGSVVLNYAYRNTDFNGSTSRATIYRNGVKVAQRSSNFSNGVTSPDIQLAYHGPLIPGDEFEFRAFRDYGNTGTVIGDRTYLRASEPTLLPQRMKKNGATSGTNVNPLTGWTSDANNPSVITSNKMVVGGSGLAELYYEVLVSNKNSDDNGKTIQLWHNSILVDEWTIPPSGNTTYQRGPFPITATNGDTVYLAVTGGTGTSVSGTIGGTGTWVEIRPQ